MSLRFVTFFHWSSGKEEVILFKVIELSIGMSMYFIPQDFYEYGVKY